MNLLLAENQKVPAKILRDKPIVDALNPTSKIIKIHIDKLILICIIDYRFFPKIFLGDRLIIDH